MAALQLEHGSIYQVELGQNCGHIGPFCVSGTFCNYDGILQENSFHFAKEPPSFIVINTGVCLSCDDFSSPTDCELYDFQYQKGNEECTKVCFSANSGNVLVDVISVRDAIFRNL